MTSAAQEKSVANRPHQWWSRLRLALTVTVIVFIAITAMRTTNAPHHFDRGAFLIFEDALLPAILASALALAFLRYGDKMCLYVDKVPRWVLDVLLFAASFAFTLRFTFKAFGAWPQIQDEIAYDLLARRIALGHPIPASHPLYEFFRIRFMVDDGHNYPLFQPGWPLLLAFFYKIKAHVAAPAFAVGMLTMGTSRLAERVYGRFTSLLAGALVMSSGFVNVVGCAYFSHAWAAALLVLSLERLHAAFTEEDPKKARRAAIVAGLWGAWLVITRLPTALTLIAAGIIGILALGVESVRPPRLLERAKKPLIAMTIAFSLGPIAQAGWNLATTHRAFELPQDKYFNQTEPVPGCHRIGFGNGIGCPREHPLDTPKGGYTLERAMVVSNMRWAVFRADAWGTAWPIALAGLFLARPLRRRDAMIVAATLTPLAVYFGFYYHAIQHGARLWADMMGPLSVVIAAGAVCAFEKGEEPSRFRAWLSALALVIMVLVIHDEHTRDLPERLVNLNRERQAERVFKNMEATRVPHGAVVYVGNCVDADRGDVVYGWASVLNKMPPESGDRFIVRDFGSDHDRQLVTLMPGWTHTRVDCNGRQTIFENPTPSPRHIITELEAKFPPDDREGCYAAIKPLGTAFNKQILEVRVDKAAAWARFRQYVFEPGTYDVRVAIVKRPDGGRFTLAFDGKAMDAVDSKGSFTIEVVSLGQIPLTAGTHNVELRSLDTTGVTYLALDRLELVKRD